MKETQIDGLIQYLWTEFQTDNKDTNIVITDLLNELKKQLIGYNK